MLLENQKMLGRGPVGGGTRQGFWGGPRKYVSPLYAPEALLAPFPDTLVLTAGLDSLCLEGEQFALKLAQAGVCVTVQRFPDSIHGFVVNQVCQWQEGQKRLMDYIASKL